MAKKGRNYARQYLPVIICGRGVTSAFCSRPCLDKIKSTRVRPWRNQDWGFYTEYSIIIKNYTDLTTDNGWASTDGEPEFNCIIAPCENVCVRLCVRSLVLALAGIHTNSNFLVGIKGNRIHIT